MINNNQSRKIIQFFDRYYPTIGGVQENISNIVRSTEDYEFVIATNALPKYPLNENYGKNIKIKRFPPNDYSLVGFRNPSISKVMFPYSVLSDIIRLYNKKRYLNKQNFDLLHVHGSPIIISNIIRLAMILDKPLLMRYDNFKLKNKPVLLTMHGLYQQLSPNKIIKDYENNFINQFENIICVDRNIYDFMLKKYEDSDSKRIYFIPNFVDTNAFSFSEIRNRDRLVIGFVGRLESSKGIDLLRDFINRLPENMELRIAVAGNRRSIEKFKLNTNLSRIQIYFNLRNEEISNFLRDIDILFNPVLSEGISRVTLEAMSCGRPVIMINQGDRHPIIHDKTGFLIDKDINDLIILLKYLINNKEKLRILGKNARRIVEKEFSNRILAPRIYRIYDELMEY